MRWSFLGRGACNAAGAAVGPSSLMFTLLDPNVLACISGPRTVAERRGRLDTVAKSLSCGSRHLAMVWKRVAVLAACRPQRFAEVVKGSNLLMPARSAVEPARGFLDAAI